MAFTAYVAVMDGTNDHTTRLAINARLLGIDTTASAAITVTGEVSGVVYFTATLNGYALIKMLAVLTDGNALTSDANKYAHQVIPGEKLVLTSDTAITMTLILET